MSGLPSNVVSLCRARASRTVNRRVTEKRKEREESLNWWGDVLDLNMETLARGLQAGKTIVIRGRHLDRSKSSERTLDIFDVEPGVAEKALSLPKNQP